MDPFDTVRNLEGRASAPLQNSGKKSRPKILDLPRCDNRCDTHVKMKSAASLLQRPQHTYTYICMYMYDI